ncbi:hypothetical protein M2408_001062 [Sphingobacterium sp. BIGb0165]|nr:hypothetical protein [Sphingobacterium sp. BIGb0165]
MAYQIPEYAKNTAPPNTELETRNTAKLAPH